MNRQQLLLVPPTLLVFALIAGCQPSSKPDSSQSDKPTTAAPDSPPDASGVEATSLGKGWGHLTGRFVFDGVPPEMKPVKVTSDIEFCSKHHPLDESLVVNSENRGIANVVVALTVGRSEQPPPVHPSYDESAQDAVTLDNRQCAFVPHVVILRTTQTLQILNSDAIAHNTKIDTLSNPAINPTLPAGDTMEYKFPLPEKMPARVSCSIHPWMCAWLIVRADPYAAVSDRDGRFTIRNLPAGRWNFQVWHEKGRFITRAVRDGKAVDWPRGRLTVDIQPDQTTDLGEVHLSAQLLGATP